MRKYKRLILPVAIVLVVILAATSFYFYRKATHTNQSDELTQQEVQSLVAEVSKIALVPTGETPVVATVSDPEQLKNQPFFIDAKKGYKVLIYTNEKKAVLYDPVSKKIVNMAPLNMDSQKVSQPQDQTPSSTATTAGTKPASKKQ